MKSKNSCGKKGRPMHGQIARLLRRTVVPLLQERGYPFAAMLFNEKQMSFKLGYKSGKEKGGLVPDAIICERYIPFEEIEGMSSKEMIIIEIGDYVPDKWIDYPVIHIGFNKRVTPMLLMSNNFELETLKAIKEALSSDLPYTIEGKNLDELRDLTMLTISGIGLTSSQITDLTWGDFLEDEDHWHVRVVDDGEENYLKVGLNAIDIIKAYKNARIDNGENVSEASPVIGNLRESNKEIKVRTLQKAFARIYKSDLEIS